MGRRGGKNRSAQRSVCNSWANNPYGVYYNQGENLNQLLYEYYFDIILKLATNRFKWINLPDTCDERYLEWVLAFEGVATICYPKGMRGVFYSTRAVTDGKTNVYDNPSSWKSVGNFGWRYEVNNSNGVLVYDNNTRFPVVRGIQLYANELAHLRMTKRVNRLHQQVPFILTGPQEKKQDMVRMFQQVAEGQPAIIGTSAMDAIEFNALQTGVKYLGEELAQDEANVWNRIYTMLGIGNSTFKNERQTEDEIRGQKQPTELLALSGLSMRRRAAEKLNRRFEKYLTKGPIEVVWNQDNISENYNLLSNMQTQLKLMGGE